MPILNRLSRITWLTSAFWLLTLPAAAQTATLTVNVGGNTSGTVAVLGAGRGLCSTPASTQCTFQIPTGTAITIAANAPSGQTPGRLSSGSGPAAGCALSTCTFTMTAAAAVTATFTAGDGPVASLTTMFAGDGTGTIAADNSRCQNVDSTPDGSCTTVYLQGSTAAPTASAAPASRFSTYVSGSGSAAGCGSAARCQFTLGANSGVTATFVALSSIAVTPLSVTKVSGETQAFTAVGTYTDAVSVPIAAGPGTWAIKTPMPTPRQWPVAGSFSGKLAVVGGRVAGAPSGVNEVYDPATDTWATKAPMPTPREGAGASVNNGLLYVVGGTVAGDAPTSAVEQYVFDSNSWVTRAPMPTARRLLGVATDSQSPIPPVYAVGGEIVSGGIPTAVGTLEVYFPQSNSWIAQAPMPTPRESLVALIAARLRAPPATRTETLYAIGGNAAGGPPLATVEAYDPIGNTWSTKAPMPSGLSGLAGAVLDDNVIYVTGTTGDGTAVTYKYDVELNQWSVETPPPTARTGLAAATILPSPPSFTFPAGAGTIFAVGGTSGGGASNTLEAFTPPLRWKPDSPGNARINTQGVAIANWAGSSMIRAASGSIFCATASCATLSITALPSEASIDFPVSGSTITLPFFVGGWALNRSVPFGPGVDAVHVYATPAGGTARFLGVATLNGPRPDIAAIYGAQFLNSGFNIVGVGEGLSPGPHVITVYGRNTQTSAFDVVKTASVTIVASQAGIVIDTPSPGATLTSAFEVGGWALEAAAASGTGVDAMQFYVYPNDGNSPGVYVGSGSYGLSRPDVGAIFGARFTNSGYHHTITGLGPGNYLLGVFAHSTLGGTYSIVKTLHFTVSATALMSIDIPGAESTVTSPTFNVDGWSIDRNVESTAIPGSGVDTLHVYAYPNPTSGGGAPIFLGVATIGIARPDIGGIFGSRYANSGYHLAVDRSALGLAPGVYNIVVHSHSAVTNTFNNVALVRVTLQ